MPHDAGVPFLQLAFYDVHPKPFPSAQIPMEVRQRGVPNGQGGDSSGNKIMLVMDL